MYVNSCYLAKVLLVVEPPELEGGVVYIIHVAPGAEVDGGAVRARPPDSHNVGGRGFAAAAAGNSVVAGAHGSAVDDPEVVSALRKLNFEHYSSHVDNRYCDNIVMLRINC